jgi:hypothetical protein
LSDVLKGLGVLQVVRHHAMLRRGVRVAWRRALVLVVVFVVAVLFVHKVLGPLMLVSSAILRNLSA